MKFRIAVVAGALVCMATMSFAEVRTLVVKINTPKTQPGVPIGWKVGTTYQVKVTVTTGSAFVTNAKVFVQFGGPDLVYMKHVGNGVYETTWIPQVPTARISQAAVRAERTDPNAKDEHSRLQYGADWFLYEVKK